jgi:hypothetical protein
VKAEQVDTVNSSIDIQPLLTAAKLAERLGVSQAWVLAHANGSRKPLLPSIKMGKLVRFDPEAVQRFLQECVR